MKINTLTFFCKKLEMTTIFDQHGFCRPTTKILLLPSFVSTLEQLGTTNVYRLEFSSFFFSGNSKKNTLSKQGLYNKSNLFALKYKSNNYISHFNFLTNLESKLNFFVKKKIDFKFFTNLKKIDISGFTIGKGFAGNIKRNKFKRGPMSHGSKHHRLPGSIGASTTPGRVFKNKRMAGRLGGNRQTIKNLNILKQIGNVLFVHGALPGKRNSILTISISI